MGIYDCRCGTGNYCHRHRAYKLPDAKGKQAIEERKYALRLGDETGTTNQQCGGGRRIHHKKVGTT